MNGEVTAFLLCFEQNSWLAELTAGVIRRSPHSLVDPKSEFISVISFEH
jgi:hypothetical protein